MFDTPDEAGLAVLALTFLLMAAWRLSPTVRVTARDMVGKLLFLAAVAAVAVAVLVGQ
ncbi:hypothetical protein [Stackebrandtia soli]|uniref:hypothetical protein n=1 Tax=Stackebrandtia soli TaxID=1892856 RepID=UPI0039ED14C6